VDLNLETALTYHIKHDLNLKTAQTYHINHENFFLQCVNNLVCDRELLCLYSHVVFPPSYNLLNDQLQNNSYIELRIGINNPYAHEPFNQPYTKIGYERIYRLRKDETTFY